MHNIDTTGLTALRDLQADVYKFAGKKAEIRFVGVNTRVTERFARFGWKIRESGYEECSGVQERGGPTLVFESIAYAVFWRRRLSSSSSEGDGDAIEPVRIHMGGEKV